MFIETCLETFWTHLCTGNYAKIAAKDVFFFHVAYKVDMSRENIVKIVEALRLPALETAKQ